MELSGKHHISASREKVYAALNDPEILQMSIPGCLSLEKTSDNEMAATVGVKIGALKVTFNGAVTLSNLNPPESYTLTGEGSGGSAGHAKGTADVTLLEDGVGTLLAYDLKAAVGGKMAQLGSRLIDSTAKMFFNKFFVKFSEIVSDRTSGAAPVTGDRKVKAQIGNWFWWVSALIIILGLGWFLLMLTNLRQ